MKNSEYIYQIYNLKHGYHTQPVLEIDRLEIRQATIAGLVGPNGSGKSTLLKLLGFIDKPSQGDILFKGKPAQPFSDAVRFQVTLLNQEPYLMKRSVFQNISYGLRLRGNKGDCREQVYEALSWVGLSEDFSRRQWYELSGGEAQRVALAARLALKPQVLLLDEPTASVDAASAQRIRDAASRARREWGTTLLIASHDWQWLYEICDDILHLFRGRFFGTGQENILFVGPWKPDNDGNRTEELADGQILKVSQPPPNIKCDIKSDANAAAVIDSDAFVISTTPERHSGCDHTLQGIISRLILEKSTQNIIVTLLAGNLPITAKLKQEDVCKSELYPGKNVFVHYNSRSAEWF